MNTDKIESICNEAKNMIGKYTKLEEPYNLIYRLCEALLEGKTTECGAKEDAKVKKICFVKHICSVCVNLAVDAVLAKEKIFIEGFDCYDVGGRLLITPTTWEYIRFPEEDLKAYKASPFCLAQKMNRKALDNIINHYRSKYTFCTDEENYQHIQTIIDTIEQLQKKFEEKELKALKG